PARWWAPWCRGGRRSCRYCPAAHSRRPRLFPESRFVAPWSGWRCRPPGLVALDLAAPVPAAEPGLVEPGLAEPGLADWTDPFAASDRSGLADPLGVAESGPWSARAASAPGYAAGTDPPCPADPLGVAESDPWSARAASAPCYAAGTGPPCPVAPGSR